MKKTFTVKELFENPSEVSKKIITWYSTYNVDVTTVDILKNKALDLYDKSGFLYTACELTTDQKIDLARILGKALIPSFNDINVDDRRVPDCWQAIDDFKNKLISREQLVEKRQAVITGVSYTNTAYDAASSVIYAHAAQWDDAAEYATSAVYDAIDSVFCRKNPAYPQLLNRLMIDFVNENN